MGKYNIKRKARVIKTYLKEGSIYAASKKSGVPYSTAYTDVRVWEGKIHSPKSYQDNLSILRGDGNLKKYREKWAIEHCYNSFSDYVKELAEKRKNRPENTAFSQLIDEGLKQINKTPADLSRETRESPQTINSYKQRIAFPNKNKREKILKSLGLNEKDLESRIRKIEEENKKI